MAPRVKSTGGFSFIDYLYKKDRFNEMLNMVFMPTKTVKI